jgi:hypothetical protein
MSCVSASRYERIHQEAGALSGQLGLLSCRLFTTGSVFKVFFLSVVVVVISVRSLVPVRVVCRCSEDEAM